MDVGDTLEWVQSVVASAVRNSVWLARLLVSYWAQQCFDTGMSDSRCFIPLDQQWSQLPALYTWFHLIEKPFHLLGVWRGVVFCSLALCFVFVLFFLFAFCVYLCSTNPNSLLLCSSSQTLFQRLVQTTKVQTFRLSLAHRAKANPAETLTGLLFIFFFSLFVWQTVLWQWWEYHEK